MLVGLVRFDCRGETPAVDFQSQVTLGGAGGTEDEVIGWDFRLSRNVTMLKLGIYYGYGNPITGFDSVFGFQQPHTVAIWDSNSNVLASAFFPSGDLSASLVGNFFWADIPPTALHTNETYVIGAFYPAPVNDYEQSFGPGEFQYDQVTVDPRVQFGNERFTYSPGGISLPEFSYGGRLGRFGPNFMIAEAIPEPVLDSDGDGVLDKDDQCPDTPAGAVVDPHGCAISQLAPCEGPQSGGAWRSRGAFLSARIKAIVSFRKAGLITKAQATQELWAALRGDCGKAQRPLRVPGRH